jgi:TPR repeat protein
MASSTATSKKKKKNGAAATPSLKDCANCGAPEGTVAGTPVHKPCSRCIITYYCSVKCQKHHWKEGGHKENCVARADRSVANRSAAATAAATAAAAAAAAAETEAEATTAENVVDDAAPASSAPFGSEAPANYNPSDECAICLEMLSTASVLSLPCSHSFHVACVEKLRNFGVSEVCPNCRVSLPPNPQLQYDDALQKFVRILRPLVDGETTLSKILAVRENKALVDETVAILKSTYKQGHGRSAWLLAGFHEDKYAVLGKNPAKSEEWYLRGAKLENTASMLNYANRVKEQGNLALAYKWFRRAAELGMAAAQLSVGVMLSKGDGVKQNHEEAVMWWRKSAEQTSVTCDLTGEAGEWNNGDACVKLGIAYEKGNGVKKVDYHEAMKWYCKAAEQESIEFRGEIGRNRIFEYKRGFIPEPLVGGRRSGRHDGPAHAIGNTLAASLYMQGLGVRVNCGEALRRCKLAAKYGVPTACVMITMMYQQGLVEGGEAELAEWHRRGAILGVVDSQRCYAAFLLSGSGVEKNRNEGLRWLNLAAKNGDKGASVQMKNVLNASRYRKQLQGEGGHDTDKPMDYRKNPLIMQFLESNDSRGLYGWAKTVEEGGLQGTDGSKSNIWQAAEWYKKSAELGYDEALTKMGIMLERGVGLPQDLKGAVEWYRKAADKMNPEGMFRLGLMYCQGRSGTSSDYDADESRRLWKLAANFGHKEAAEGLKRIELQDEESALLRTADDATQAAHMISKSMGAHVEILQEGHPHRGRIGEVIDGNFDGKGGSMNFLLRLGSDDGGRAEETWLDVLKGHNDITTNIRMVGWSEKKREELAEQIKAKEQATLEKAERDCARCGAAEGDAEEAPKHRKCSRCKAVFYCSQECQSAHWNAKASGHKEACKQFRKEAQERSRARAQRV